MPSILRSPGKTTTFAASHDVCGSLDDSLHISRADNRRGKCLGTRLWRPEAVHPGEAIGVAEIQKAIDEAEKGQSKAVVSLKNLITGY